MPPCSALALAPAPLLTLSFRSPHCRTATSSVATDACRKALLLRLAPSLATSASGGSSSSTTTTRSRYTARHRLAAACTAACHCCLPLLPATAACHYSLPPLLAIACHCLPLLPVFGIFCPSSSTSPALPLAPSPPLDPPPAPTVASTAALLLCRSTARLTLPSPRT